ncbi:MAG: hypothetical protein ACTHMD_17915, partial [Flavisolibacter sp.]
MIYLKLTREGLYVLRSLYMQPSKEKNADFDTWMTTYTFAFTSENFLRQLHKDNSYFQGIYFLIVKGSLRAYIKKPTVETAGANECLLYE